MIGLVAVLIIILLIVSCIVKCWPDTNIDLRTLGRWAVVTGATDGIGKAFSHELAKNGFSVFLVSRSQEKLESSANEIKEKFGVPTKTFTLDFSVVDRKLNALLRQELENLEIGLLINNVGTTSPHPEYFLELEKNHEEMYEQVINVNIMSAVNMTRYVLPNMLKRRKGLIINVSSMLSEFPSPLHSLYGGTKGFLTKFSKDLDLEYRNKGVHVHVLCTGLVATKLSGASVEEWFPPAVSPKDYAKSALKEATRRRVCAGHISHALQTLAGRTILHPWILEKIILSVMIRKKTIPKSSASSVVVLRKMIDNTTYVQQHYNIASFFNHTRT